MIEVLRGSKKKKLLKYLKQRFGFDDKLDFVFFQDEKGRVRVLSKDSVRIDTTGMRVENLGLYFARWDRDELRLSIEGSQIVGKKAKRNVVELNEKQAMEWMSGKNIEVKADVEEGFVILKYGNDFLGCGRYRDGRIVSFIPKERRIKSR